jgi:hypothetical protein
MIAIGHSDSGAISSASMDEQTPNGKPIRASPPGDLAEDFSPRFLDQAVDRCSARLPAFIYLVTEAWRRRNLAQWHKRLMLGATILVVFGPGFSRIPFSPPTFWGFTIQLFAGLVLLFAPLLIWDRRTVGKIHPATWTGFIVCAVAAAVPVVLIAQRLPGIGS